jgi:hypothetical protein
VGAALPALAATAPAALPVTPRPPAAFSAGERAAPQGADVSATAGAPSGRPQPAQRTAPATPMTEGEAVRLADRVYDLLARRIAAERGRRGG